MKTFLSSFLVMIAFMACVLIASVTIHLETYTYSELQTLVRTGLVVALFSATVNTLFVNKFKKKVKSKC